MQRKASMAMAILAGTGGPAAALSDLWDLPPLRYSESQPADAGSELARALAAGEVQLPPAGLARLRWVLRRLGVPESSQVLVFSKTSLQNGRIGPRTPRALFFSPDAYVGWVPGGAIEMIAVDATLGPVFHVIDDGPGGAARVTRDTSECFSCHGTVRTEQVPGVLVRSVFPDADGQPLLPFGSVVVDHRTPVAERWGGYWVTGRSGLPHLGNQFFREGDPPQPAPTDLATLADKFDVTRYPRPTSDVVALLVLEHQCRVHNLLTAAAMNYRRTHFLAKAIDPAADPDAGSAGRGADAAARGIVAALLFRDEADIGDGVEGDEAFQQDFAARVPRSAAGESLADFRLYGHLFKNRCSFMVYSQAFASLPGRVRSAVLAELRAVLEADHPPAGYDYLKDSERRRITAILLETLPDYRQG